MRQDEVSFKEALKEAQVLGYAEADPTDDIGGKDAFRKLMILSQLAFGKQADWETIEMRGIDQVTLEEVLDAGRCGLRYRHIAEITIDETGNLSGSVGPVLVGRAIHFTE